MFFPYRDDNPAETVPYVTIGLIVLNTLIFIIMYAGGAGVYRFSVINYGLIPAELTHFQNMYPSVAIPPALSLITSLFIHGGFLHLAGNMWFLWIFGDNVEDRLGHFRYFIFYILAGIFASLLHVAFFPDSVIPVIGASGAISGVLGAYAVFYPHARIRTFIFIFFFFTTIMVPAAVFIGIWIFFQAISGILSLGTAGGGGVAWFAHLGGFLFGIYALRFFTGKKRLFQPED
ncbi:MAG: rhomboid family intramembrane serine protease [Acidobacteria bacterium]|nr:rhomboid family intramembrane serine protease [Acidobacteriota bacterium]